MKHFIAYPAAVNGHDRYEKLTATVGLTIADRIRLTPQFETKQNKTKQNRSPIELASRTVKQLYAPPFRAAVQEAGVKSAMEVSEFRCDGSGGQGRGEMGRGGC
jgi:hypothetical protein